MEIITVDTVMANWFGTFLIVMGGGHRSGSGDCYHHHRDC